MGYKMNCSCLLLFRKWPTFIIGSELWRFLKPSLRILTSYALVTRFQIRSEVSLTRFGYVCDVCHFNTAHMLTRAPCVQVRQNIHITTNVTCVKLNTIQSTLCRALTLHIKSHRVWYEGSNWIIFVDFECSRADSIEFCNAAEYHR